MIAYDDDQQRVPVVHPEVYATDPIAEILGQRGIEPTPALLDALDAAVDAQAARRASDALRRIVLALPKTPASLGLARALLGESAGSLGELAEQAGCSRPAILKWEQRCARAIRRLTA